MTTFAIVTNLTNGVGLERDYKLIRGILERAGHTVHGIMWNETFSGRKVDVNIFLEVLAPFQVGLGTQNWLIPNSEWWLGGWGNYFLTQFNRILCKTHDCYDIWSQRVGQEKCTYIGFEANDFYRPEVPRERTFLHLAGKSETKNTQAVMDAWRLHKLPYKLIAASSKPSIMDICRGVPNVKLVERFTEEEVIEHMNRCMFHVMPSLYEGYGHAMHEALGCGGTVITTNAPPMNTFEGIHPGFLVPVKREELHGVAKFYYTDPAQLADAVHSAAAMPDEMFTQIHNNARASFLKDREFFRAAFAKVVPNA